MTILLTTHYLEEADRLASQLAIVDRGRIVARGTPDELKGELRGDTVQVELAERRRRRPPRPRWSAWPGARGGARRAARCAPARDDGGAAVPGRARRAARRTGVRAAAVTVARPSLDDVYLRHAGRSLGGGGMTALRQTWQVTLRYLRVLARQPAFLVITLVQPIIWLLLFGALFKAVTEIPGFAGGSYIDFLTPGVVVMLAVSSAGWTGMAFIEDINSGVMDRMLASPVWRGALNLGSVAQAVIQILIQTLLIVLLALALGAHYAGGVGGVLILMLVAALLGAAFASLSNGLGVLTRQRESLIGAVTLRAAAADVPVLGADAAEPGAGLDRHGREVQPGQLGRRGGPLRGDGADRLGPGGRPRRAPVRARRARGGVRDAGVRDLSAVALDEAVLVGEHDGLHAVAEARASAAGGARAS